MKKLVIATDNFLPRWDGIARFLAEMIPRLKSEYEITVISPDYGLTKYDLGIRRVLIPISRSMYGDYIPALFRPSMVKAAIKNADIVFTQTIGPIGCLAQRYARKYKKPLAAFIHSIEWELVPRALDFPLLRRISYPFMKLFTRYLYNRCNLLIMPSDNIADMFTWQKISTRKKIVHLGVDTKKFTHGDRVAVREQLDIEQDALVIGFHGRIGYEKNLLTLTRAYLRLRHKNKRLLIVGEGNKELKDRLAKIKGVLLVGKQDDVVPFLQAMDMYVLPSFTETTSLAVLEAMACELPVISSPVGFIQQYIQEGRNGYFFETKNAYNLSRKLKMLADDEKNREKIGKAARRTVVEKFNWDKTAEGILEALRNIKK